ncbi:MAG TPA: hypothetical protein PLV42_12410 [bacterium]|nr:hypothetical protein [bacterium]
MNMRWMMLLATMFLLCGACTSEPKDDIGKYDYLNDLENYYTDEEYADLTDGDSIVEKQWQVKFQFYGIINGESTPTSDLRFGDGRLTYIDDAGEEVVYIGALWVMKKNINNSAGHEIPLLQVFFAQHLEDGEGITFVLQLDGSSMTKKEVFYLNNDKLYMTDVTRTAGEISKICFKKDAVDGIVHLFSNSIREGEPLSLDGYADLRAMDPVDCKTLE